MQWDIGLGSIGAICQDDLTSCFRGAEKLSLCMDVFGTLTPTAK
jgi:hypothetical protein